MISVQLRAAKIPWIGWLAVHYWYVVQETDRQERWEVWQQAGLRGNRWGHLYQDLLPATAGVGNGDSWVKGVWSGPEGDRLAEILRRSPEIYPYCGTYRYWPGPNSNTYAQWVLNQARCEGKLCGRAWGKGYLTYFA